MRFDIPNTIVTNVLSEDEISQVYSAIDNSHNSYLMEKYVQSVKDFRLPDSVKEKVIKLSEEISGESNLEISEYQFARYQNITKEDGTVLKPNLSPHFDDMFPESRFTFDYQIGGNCEWPLSVEHRLFALKNNEALTFSGTHQVHWREKMEFADGQFIDMVFFHLRKIGDGPKPEDLNKHMKEKTEEFRVWYNSTKEKK
jgi:hypothetical protein